MVSTPASHPLFVALGGLGLAALLAVGAAAPASAATTIDGPVNLGTAAPFGVLGASTVTNTGPTRVTGDVGLSPGSSITGFGAAPNGTVTGTIHKTDATAKKAQADTTTAYNTAASLTPTRRGVSELSGLSLTPGVYTGGALKLSDNGALTLAGTANSVWVFQAASTLTIGSATNIVVTGGASACNVFWQVGSSATIGSAAQFQGSVLARQSITATTGATIVGRLLARAGAVTLDTNTITAPTGCPASGTITSSPVITSGTPTAATAGSPYSYTVTATGSPKPTFSLTGTLPTGLTFNGTTGTISGTPTTPGTTTVTITATSSASPPSSVRYSIVVRPRPRSVVSVVASSPPVVSVPVAGTPSGPQLAFTGADSTGPLTAAAVLLLAGFGLVAAGARRRRCTVRRH
jgi:hypothetical protein